MGNFLQIRKRGGGFLFCFFGNFLNLYVFWSQKSCFLGHIYIVMMWSGSHISEEMLSRCFASVKRLKWKTNKTDPEQSDTLPGLQEITEGETEALVLGQLIGQGNYVLMLQWLHLYPLTGEAQENPEYICFYFRHKCLFGTPCQIQFVWKLRCCTLALGLFELMSHYWQIRSFFFASFPSFQHICTQCLFLTSDEKDFSTCFVLCQNWRL